MGSSSSSTSGWASSSLASSTRISQPPLKLEQRRPLSLAQLAECDRLAGCDRATVYRLLVRLESNGIVRRLGLHERSAFFTLLLPGEHRDYLICTECGTIDTIDIACPVEALEKEVQRKSGFRGLYHELEFFGVCPSCA